ncbi:hypothetical protein ABGB12_04770 [Actinocorallia sp. B10E7]|uniref:PspA-associated protein PspAB n=1 Tax=Actinocorallia sp. B10E7 TaxID=3153558 RepID=UPI00325EB01F
MGFLDTLLGRSKPAKPDLDRLFALPSAAITLQASTGYAPAGVGSVCFATVEGTASAELRQELRDLLDAVPDAPSVELTHDEYGYTWLVSHHTPEDLPSLVNDLHAVNTTLQDNGFGSQLLCSLAAFRNPSARPLALIYLYKRGTFYPFAPLPGQRRNNHLEFQVKDLLREDLPLEPDLTRWFPVWGAPGL